jgi:tetratricopeptide (TPR) repeat protein
MNQNEIPQTNHSGLQKFFIPISLFFISLATFLIYSNILHGPFIFDDIANIKENPLIKIEHFSFLSIKNLLYSLNGQRPIPLFSFAINYFFDHYNTFGYHVVNILIHILNGILLFFITDILLSIPQNKYNTYSRKIISLTSAALWILNPLHIFSVTYIVQRMNSMAAMFAMFAILSFLKLRLLYINTVIQKEINDPKNQIKRRFKIHSGIYISAIIFSTIAAIASKQNTIILPFLLLLIEIHFFSPGPRILLKKLFSTKKRGIVTSLSLTLILTAFIIIFFANTYGSPLHFLKNMYKGHSFTLIERLHTQARLLIYYISLIFYPSPSRLTLLVEVKKSLSVLKPISTLFSYITISALLIAGIIAYRKNFKLFSFAIFWFFSAHLVESTILPLELVYIHRNYIPSMFIFLPFAVLAFRPSANIFFQKVKILIRFILWGMIFIFIFFTYQYNKVWESAVTFWSDNAKKSPHLERVQANYGTALFEANQPNKAEKAYLKAIKINSKNYITYFNLARIYDETNKNKKALKFYSASLRRNKKFKSAWSRQGFLLFSLGDRENGLNCLYQAWKIDKYDPETNTMLGNSLYQEGKIKGALFHLGKALEIDPLNVDANTTMALIAMDAKDYKNAERFFKKVLQADKSNSLAIFNLGFIKQKLNEERKGTE